MRLNASMCGYDSQGRLAHAGCLPQPPPREPDWVSGDGGLNLSLRSDNEIEILFENLVEVIEDMDSFKKRVPAGQRQSRASLKDAAGVLREGNKSEEKPP
jgi:hypothetical protein